MTVRGAWGDSAQLNQINYTSRERPAPLSPKAQIKAWRKEAHAILVLAEEKASELRRKATELEAQEAKLDAEYGPHG